MIPKIRRICRWLRKNTKPSAIILTCYTYNYSFISFNSLSNAFNIGIHLFDLAINTFGKPSEFERDTIEVDDHHAMGGIALSRAAVGFDLATPGGRRPLLGEPKDY